MRSRLSSLGNTYARLHALSEARHLWTHDRLTERVSDSAARFSRFGTRTQGKPTQVPQFLSPSSLPRFPASQGVAPPPRRHAPKTRGGAPADPVHTPRPAPGPAKAPVQERAATQAPSRGLVLEERAQGRPQPKVERGHQRSGAEEVRGDAAEQRAAKGRQAAERVALHRRSEARQLELRRARQQLAEPNPPPKAPGRGAPSDASPARPKTVLDRSNPPGQRGWGSGTVRATRPGGPRTRATSGGGGREGKNPPRLDGGPGAYVGEKRGSEGSAQKHFSQSTGL